MNKTSSNWEAVIGLEVHVQLLTQSKLFSGASAAYGVAPNTQASAIDLGLPGVLPVLNKEAVKMAVKLGLAIDATINSPFIFSRKHYFYPDLPKGYQISQSNRPIVAHGELKITLEDGTSKIIKITRAHLEEDAGKSLHNVLPGFSGIDLNRAGTALLEIVSEPDLRSAKEAIAYLKALYALVTYLEICDGNMQEGSFRCDANVSVRRAGSALLGTRTEIKNVNSFRFVERAINYEIDRQIETLESGGQIIQETRLYDADQNKTIAMRSKENANDYRYFPDPDLLPFLIENEMIETIKKTIPELPEQKRLRFIYDFDLPQQDATLLVSDRYLANYFESVLKQTQTTPKQASNWITVELLSFLNKENKSILDSPVESQQLAKLLDRIADNTISGKIAKTVFEALWNGEGDVDEIIQKRSLKQVTDTKALEKLVDDIIAQHTQQHTDYRAGKEKLFGFFVGQVMKLSQGKANPQEVNRLLKEKL